MQEHMVAHAAQETDHVHDQTHGHHHHHAPGQGHPPAKVGPSLLRMTVGARFSIAAALIALIWAVVVWAMS
jgi:hypothetical protein